MKDTETKKNSSALPLRNVLIIVAAFAVVVAVGLILLSTLKEDPESPATSTYEVYISEVMTSNPSLVKAPDGDFYDYMELYNPTDKPQSLSGWSLLEADNANVYVFPQSASVPANGYLVLWCGGKNADGLVTGFGISKSGNQTFILRDADGTAVDAVTTSPDLERGNVLVRAEDKTWSQSNLVTPGYANTEEGRAAYLADLDTPAVVGVEISEIIADQHTVLPDAYGEYSDIIELHNVSGAPLRLKNFTLTDDRADPYAWTFPDITLEADGYVVVRASGRDISRADAELHASFKLNAYGETVTLYDATGHFVCDVTYAGLETNQSLQKQGDRYVTTYSPTPGFANTPEGLEAFAATLPLPEELVLWEVMSKNNSVLPLNGGQYYDWVELRNNTDHDIELSDYALTDDIDNLSKAPLPKKTLKPGAYIVLVCSGTPSLSTSEYKHLALKINGDEELFLAKNGVIVDRVCAKGTALNTAVGRLDDRPGWSLLAEPTPGKANSTKNAVRDVASTPVVLTAPGVYNDIDGLTVYLDAPGTVYYALYSGSADDKTAKKTDFFLYDRAEGIKLTETCAVRAYSVEEGKAKSNILSASYVINEHHTLDVVCVTLAFEDMWSDKTGIYAFGPGDRGDEDHKGSNFWKDWERAGNAELFCADGSEGFSVPCGVKIFGGYGRHLDKKSFSLKFRSLYGMGELNYNVFDNGVGSFETLVLRSGSQDASSSLLRDEWVTSLAASVSDNILVQSYRPIVLYVNGQYFGVYYIREKIGSDMISKHENVSRESVNLVECNHRLLEGSNEDYTDIIAYVKSHDLSKKENYDYLCTKIDILSFIDYRIAEFFSGNQDTGNIRFYMSREDDGKWHWILYDLDYGFYYYTSLDFYLTRYRNGYYEVNTLSTHLIKNKEFVDLFIRRCAEQFKNGYDYDHAVGMLDELAAKLDPEMQRNCDRWGNSYEKWKKTLDTLRSDVAVQLGLKKYVYRSGENGYYWTFYSRIQRQFNLSKAQMQDYFGDVKY